MPNSAALQTLTSIFLSEKADVAYPRSLEPRLPGTYPADPKRDNSPLFSNRPPASSRPRPSDTAVHAALSLSTQSGVVTCTPVLVAFTMIRLAIVVVHRRSSH